MELIKNFGLEPMLLGAQIINFLIILFILKRFLYRPVLEILKKRQNVIKDGLKQAEDAKIRLEKVIIEEKSILTHAQLQSRKIIEDAKLEAIETIKKINEGAKLQAEKMLIDAREQITRESMETEKRLALKISKLAVTFLEKALKDFFSSKEQEKVISSVLKKIKN